ncbi:hypothetical protein GCM10023231_41900 [Olivibacter ginsenosidimutans]|uniref:TonB-dependent receptor n=2 Tax=Olivibacter ginsenosidimutans TaxID=1176537 RepID=A0ABP9CFX7_9SPHI
MVFPIFLWGQKAEELELGQRLTDWIAREPIEKVYVHLDKPYYAVGDTIWFKVYVTDGNQRPSLQSGAVYVDVVDQADSLVHALKLPLMNGLGKGSVVLSDELNAGNYRIQAYTQWMRNAGTEFFYRRVFPVGNVKEKAVIGTASLVSYPQKNGIKKLIRLHFTETEKTEPVKNAPVNYTLKTSKHNYTGRGITTEEGDLLVDVDQKIMEDSVYRIQSTIALDQVKLQRNFTIHQQNDSIEVAFFPEGGTLIANLQQRVAVKVTGADGFGLAVHGEVKNHKGEMITTWDTQHAGMGLFSFLPLLGESYKAYIRFPDGTAAVYPLPQATTTGHALSVYSNTGTDSVLIRLQATPDVYGVVHLLGQQNGKVVFSETLNQQRSLVQLYLSKTLFPSGINQFTLFDGMSQPVAERIAFLEQPDSLLIEIPAINSRIRDSVAIPLQVKGDTSAVFTSLSVSVTDEEAVPIANEQENTIFTQLLLQSDIRGYIEAPNYYFYAVDNKKRDHLDLLLMTQGYRHFAWKEIAEGIHSQPQFAAEHLLQHISGTLLTLRGRPVEDGKITLFSNRLGVVMNTETDAQGHFRFDNLLIQDSLAFTIQGRKPKGSNKVEIKLDEISRAPLTFWKIPDPMSAYGSKLKTYLGYKQQVADSDALLTDTHQLEEVEVTAKKDQYLNIRGLSIPMKQLDYVIHPKASDSCKNLLECIRRWVPGITFGFVNRGRDAGQTNIRPIVGVGANASSMQPINVGGGPGSSGAGILTGSQYHQQHLQMQGGGLQIPVLISGGREMQLLYNGFPVRAYDMDDPASADLNYEYLLKDRKAFNPDNIKAIYIKEFSGTGAFITGLTNIDTRCFLYVETYDGLIYPPNPDWDYTLLKPQGFSMVREFYSPRYDRGPEEAKQADRRSTIYWNPDLRTDKTGRTSFGYFNAGRPGTYRVVIEGLNSKGQLGRKVLRYTVEE